MKPSQALRKAAILVFKYPNQVGGCTALSHIYKTDITNYLSLGLAQQYLNYFYPDHHTLAHAGFWWGIPNSYQMCNQRLKDSFRHLISTPEDVNARILGLLFAAAIAESEGN